MAQYPRIEKEGEIAWKLYTLALGKRPAVVVPRRHGQQAIESEPPPEEPGGPTRKTRKDEASSGSSGDSSSGFVRSVPARPKPRPAPVRKEGDEGLAGVLGGTTELVFLKLDSGALVRATPKGTTPIKHEYEHVVELGPGQWLGRRRDSKKESDFGEPPPVHYELLAGTGNILPIPPHIVPYGAIHLGDGRICAREFPRLEGDETKVGVWTADLAGHQNEARVSELKDIFRGADGACWALTEKGGVGIPFTRAIVPIRGDVTGAPIAVPIGNEPTRLDRQGGIWDVGDDEVLVRTTVEGGKVKVTPYPLPSTIEDCELPRVHDVAALAPDDVWVVVECANRDWQDAGGYKYRDDRRVLMHTGPASQPVFAWPAY